MALSSNFIQQVKAGADVVRIIEEHLRLRKSHLWKERAHEPTHGVSERTDGMKGPLLPKPDSDFEAAVGISTAEPTSDSAS